MILPKLSFTLYQFFVGRSWPLDQSARAPILLDLGERRRWFTERPWPETPRQAYIVPFRSADPKTPLGYLVTGVSPRLRWDERYSTFLEATARQIGADIAAATMLRAERERAEALAELDRAKTVFFTNISHEFRTPLTLLLGPVEELLGASSDGTRAPLEVIHRNALRLLKLVNSLLEFSRIEAGRMEMDLVATDLAAYTAELASSFRSAAEKAGLEFHVHCAPLATTVAVDRGMWEKIVLNLLSNAFKFTLLGTITVRLEAVAEEVRLSVADTGVGMAEDEVPRLFERFHRAAGKMGRSFEGTGIGLAMTRDLVKLHGGWIQASSRLGHGTTITVHLPLDARGSSANTAAGGQVGAIGTDFARSTVNEVLQMAAVSGTAAGKLGDAAILVADDNADMREYLVRLLAPHYRVRAVSNGAEALAAAETAPPDLIVSDVMMPSLDGFELLRELRQRAATRPIPVILVSARAGEEALVTGLGQGADDYLTKPFTARELLARVAAQLNLQERRRDLERKERDLRRQAEAAEMRYHSILTNMTDAVAELDGDGVIRACSARFASMMDLREGGLGTISLAQVLPLKGTVLETACAAVSANRIGREGEDFLPSLRRWIRWMLRPEAEGYWLFLQDISAEKHRAHQLLISEKLAATGRLAASFSHEINNPLASVTNLLYLIQDLLADPVSHASQVQTYAATAMREINRVSELARQAMNLYRSGASSAPVNPARAIENALSVFEAKLRSRRIQVDRQLANDAAIEAITGEVDQIVFNLVANAIDAMPQGGRLRVEAEPDAKGVWIGVSDSGKGIETHAREHLFEPFFTTKADVGTGLGLWAVNQIVTNHGGRIEVESPISAEDKGTRIRVWMPRRAAPNLRSSLM